MPRDFGNISYKHSKLNIVDELTISSRVAAKIIFIIWIHWRFYVVSCNNTFIHSIQSFHSDYVVKSDNQVHASLSFQKPACSCLSHWSTASEIHLMMSWLGSCWGQTEGWLLSSCYSFSGLLSSESSQWHPLSSRQVVVSPPKFLLKNLCGKLWLCLEESCVEAVLSHDFSVFEWSDGCHDFFFRWLCGADV